MPAKCNTIAGEIMQAAGIPVHDLLSMVKNDFTDSHLRVADVHYTKAGSRLFAEDVARVISEALDPRASSAATPR